MVPVMLRSLLVGPMEPATKRGLRGGGILVGDFARQFGGGEVEFVGAICELVIGQRDPRAAEGVGLDDIGAGFEILAVDLLYHVGPRDVEDFRAVLPAPGSRSRWTAAPHGSWCPWRRRVTSTRCSKLSLSAC